MSDCSPTLQEGISAGEAKAIRDKRDIKLGRIQEPEDVAKLVSFLVSDEGEYLGGAIAPGRATPGIGRPRGSTGNLVRGAAIAHQNLVDLRGDQRGGGCMCDNPRILD